MVCETGRSFCLNSGWFSKAKLYSETVGFFRRMAEQVDFVKLRSDDFREKPEGINKLRGKSRFDPVRRKLYLEDC